MDGTADIQDTKWPARPLVSPDLMTPVEAAMFLRLDGIRELAENPRPDDTLVIGSPPAQRCWRATYPVRRRRTSLPNPKSVNDIFRGSMNRWLQLPKASYSEAATSKQRERPEPCEHRSCSVCKELLANLGRFLEMLEAARDSHQSDWLTVEDIAQELKLSKSIVYRLIRNGELDAVDLVAGDQGKIPRKGHFRIRQSALNQYLEAKRVKPLPNQPTRLPPPPVPKVKNHLAL